MTGGIVVHSRRVEGQVLGQLRGVGRVGHGLSSPSSGRGCAARPAGHQGADGLRLRGGDLSGWGAPPRYGHQVPYAVILVYGARTACGIPASRCRVDSSYRLAPPFLGCPLRGVPTFLAVDLPRAAPAGAFVPPPAGAAPLAPAPLAPAPLPLAPAPLAPAPLAA